MFYRFIGLVWDVLIFQARALAVQAVVVTLAVSAAPEVQTVRDVRAWREGITGTSSSVTGDV